MSTLKYFDEMPELTAGEFGMLERIVEYTYAYEAFVHSVSQDAKDLCEMGLIKQDSPSSENCWVCTPKGFSVWLDYNRRRPTLLTVEDAKSIFLTAKAKQMRMLSKAKRRNK